MVNDMANMHYYLTSIGGFYLLNEKLFLLKNSIVHLLNKKYISSLKQHCVTALIQ